MARELLAITGLAAQELVHLARSAFGAVAGAATVAAGCGGQRPDSTAANIAEVMMGRDAWDTHKNSAYKSMEGPRKPEGSAATKKRTQARNRKLGGTLDGWYVAHFAGEDTRWSMDHMLTWLPPNGDVTAAHLETLGNMISEVFHQHKIKNADKIKDASKKIDKKSSTAAEASDWNGDTSVHGTDFFNTKK